MFPVSKIKKPLGTTDADSGDANKAEATVAVCILPDLIHIVGVGGLN